LRNPSIERDRGILYYLMDVPTAIF